METGSKLSTKEWDELYSKDENVANNRDNYVSCKNCGYINLESDENCEDCGTELTLDIDINPQG